MKYYVYLFILTGVILSASCGNGRKADEAFRIVYVNSYHEGYGSSDDVMEGIRETLQQEDKVDLKIFFLDAKRKTAKAEVTKAAQYVLREINELKPDLLIVSDDNAVKDLVVPYFNNMKLPVVFCGVNWSAEQYKLGSNVTGMLEVLPLRECLNEVIMNNPGTKKLVVLSENSLSEQNNRVLLDTLYRNLGLEVIYSLADDFDSWKKLFREASQNADLIYMPTNGAVRNWNDSLAKEFVEQNIRIPVVTCDDFMMPYAVFGLTKVAQEQGIWAANTALDILYGKSPAEIPIARNSETRAWINKTLAGKIDFKMSEQMKKHVTNF